MPKVRYGNATVETINWTTSFGITPATCEIKFPAAVPLSIGTNIIFAIPGRVIRGRTKGALYENSESTGTTTTLRIVDERALLPSYSIKAQFNMRDRDGTIFQILPNDWSKQAKTTGTPLLPITILQHIIDQTPFFSMVFSLSAALIVNANNMILDSLDWNTGKKASMALLEVSDLLGLQFTVDEDIGISRTLYFVRKGEVEQIFLANFTRWSEGTELTLDPLSVEVIGDRNRYELQDVPLEPDWNTLYDEWSWDEDKMIDDLESTITATGKNLYNLTIQDIVDNLGSAYNDSGTYNKRARSTMLLYDYINLVTYKAYRIPRTLPKTADPVAEANQRISDRLVSDVTRSEIVKGTVIRRSLRDIAQNRLIATEDQEISGYTIDRENWTVLFQERMFSGDILDIANLRTPGNKIPLDVTKIQPDNATITIAVEREVYSFIFGLNFERDVHHVNNLYREFLTNKKGKVKQEVIRNGISADDFAVKVAQRYLFKRAVLQNGSFSAAGVLGRKLRPGIDRITVTLDGSQGYQETVSYSTGEPDFGVLSERKVGEDLKAREWRSDLEKLNEIENAVEAAERQQLSRNNKEVVANVSSADWLAYLLGAK